MTSEDPQFVYIMGRGHSGSTVLDALLGNSKSMHSVGEIVSGMPRSEDICSCGEKIGECNFWNTVKSKFEERSGFTWDQATKLIQEQAHLKSFIKTMFTYSDSEIDRLIKVNRILFEVISEVSGRKMVIDSSKEFTRGLFLTKYMPNGKVIHLIRNPLRILASNLLRIKEGRFKVLRHTFDGKSTAMPFILISALGWLVGNILGELVSLTNRRKVLKVRYEDLSEYPAEELKRIGAFLDCDLTDVVNKVEKSEEMEIEHMIAGNRMRRNGSFVFKPGKKSRKRIPWYYSVLGVLVTWPLMLRYGYLKS